MTLSLSRKWVDIDPKLEEEEEEYESSTNWEGNSDLFESTAPESATAKSKSAPLKAGNNVETLPSELRAARREKQKAIRTPTNTSRGRGRSGSGGLGYLPTPRSNDSNAGPSRLPDERSRISKKSRKGERCVFGSCNLNPATVVLKTSTQLDFPFPYTPEHINSMEKEINKRLDKLESFAINTNALAKNAREEFYKDTVVLRLRGLAHQVTLFEIQSLNQATIAQILTEVQATNACMDGMKTRMDEMSNIISQRKLGNVLAGLSGLLHAASATSAIVGRSAPKVSPDAVVTHALSSEDEFPGLDIRELDGVDFQQLNIHVLGKASVVGEDDGPPFCESEVI
ncbi:uncharacterized protein Y057_2376 [Fusarium fujikuroi]|nr:uncharacterized protein Y057_2376 [Fusarium fujikuroi]